MSWASPIPPIPPRGSFTQGAPNGGSYSVEQLDHRTPGGGTLLRYDVLLKAKKPAMERHFMVRDAFAHRRMVGVTRTILRAIEHDVFNPVVDWRCKECPFKSHCDTEP